MPTIAAHDDPMERLPAIKQVPDERSSVLLRHVHATSNAGMHHVAAADAVDVEIMGHTVDMQVAGSHRTDIDAAADGVKGRVAGADAPDLHVAMHAVGLEVAGTDRSDMDLADVCGIDIARSDIRIEATVDAVHVQVARVGIGVQSRYADDIRVARTDIEFDRQVGWDIDVQIQVSVVLVEEAEGIPRIVAVCLGEDQAVERSEPHHSRAAMA